MGSIIGDNIRRLRIKANLTQKELAEELGISYAAIANFEAGEVPPPMKLSIIAAYFRVTVDDMIHSEFDAELAEFEENYNTTGSQIIQVLIAELKLKNEIIRALLARLTNERP